MSDGEDINGTAPPSVIVAETTASLLALGAVLDRWSRLIALLAGLLILLLLATQQPVLPEVCGILSLLAALGQAYYAARVTIDARLFDNWAKRWHTLVGTPNLSDHITADLTHFDQQIEGLRDTCNDRGLRQPRDLHARQRGALGLLRRQGVCLALQLLAFAGSLACAFWLWQPLRMFH